MMESQAESQQHSQPTGTVTFRIDAQVLTKLKKHATYEKSTVNGLVNKLLLQAIEWDVVAAKSKWIPTERELIKSILDKLDDKMITHVAQAEGKNIPRDLCLSMRGNYSVNDWIDIIKMRSVVSGFDLTEINAGKMMVFVMRHDLGEKYSLHCKAFYEQAFESLECPATFEISENTLVFKIPNSFLAE
ncbi:MAG: hypothetical protein ACREBI_10370 [Nitrosotalea sp.]